MLSFGCYKTGRHSDRHTNREREGEIQRQRDRQTETDRNRHRQSDRQADRYRESPKDREGAFKIIPTNTAIHSCITQRERESRKAMTLLATSVSWAAAAEALHRS